VVLRLSPYGAQMTTIDHNENELLKIEKKSLNLLVDIQRQALDSLSECLVMVMDAARQKQDMDDRIKQLNKINRLQHLAIMEYKSQIEKLTR
jgi:hypothetical protein